MLEVFTTTLILYRKHFVGIGSIRAGYFSAIWVAVSSGFVFCMGVCPFN